MVASPEPLKIIEIETVKKLSDAGDVVIAVGGGGIPVIGTNEGLKGITAVIDKDKSAAVLAAELEADILMILTEVDRVCLDFNTANQRELESMSVKEAYEHIANGEFAPGSMLPKVEACITFLKNNPNGKAVISSLSKAKSAFEGGTGTLIKATLTED